MEHFNTIKVSEKAAHLFNALRLLEEVNDEIYHAFIPVSEEEAASCLECIETPYKHVRETIKDWIALAAQEWAISQPAAAEF